MEKGKRKPKRHLKFKSSTEEHFFNVKSCDIQQLIRYFKLFANWYVNIPKTDFQEKVNSFQQLQNEHM